MMKTELSQNYIMLKDIPGYEGIYAASISGKIWSYYSKQWLKEIKEHTGYYTVSLYKDKKMKKWLVHRLIAITFLGEVPEGMNVDHIDGDKTNNELSNLQYLTVAQNTSKSNKGKKHSLATKIKLSSIMKGKNTWAKGSLKGSYSEEHRKNISESITKWWKNRKVVTCQA